MSDQPEKPADETNSPAAEKPAAKVPLKPPSGSLVSQAVEKKAAENTSDSSDKPVLPPAPAKDGEPKAEDAAPPRGETTPPAEATAPASDSADPQPTAEKVVTKPKIIAPPASASRPAQEQPARPLKVAHAPVLPPRPATAAAGSAGSPPAAAAAPAEGNVLALAFDFVVAAVAITFATLILLDLFS